MNHWVTYLILYLFLHVIFTQFYKISTKTLKSAGALTVLLQLLGGISAILVSPLFGLKFPNTLSTYGILGIAIIFYAVSDRINTTVRSGMEASTFNVLGQLSTTFMTIAGIVILKEEFVLNKFIGAMLIIFSNIFLFLSKRKNVI